MTTHRHLLLLRHGKSDWNAGAASDFSRPLNARGKRDSLRMGQWIGGQGLQPDYIISSPAERARTTAEYICEGAGLDPQVICLNESLYLADPDDLLEAIGSTPPDTGCLLLVGHNPGLEQLLASLAGNSLTEPEDGKLMPTATLAHLQISSSVQQPGPGHAHLVELVRPRTLQP